MGAPYRVPQERSNEHCLSPAGMVETWNEFHEGTDVAESQEYGRQYIEMTREYAERFKAER